MSVKSALLLSILAKGSATPIEQLCANNADVTVETLVFSGTPNPVFSLKGDEWRQMCNAIADSADSLTLPTCRVLGFTGFKVCFGESDKMCAVLRGNPVADQLLFSAVLKHVPDMQSTVADHISDELARLHQSNGGDVKCKDEELAPVNATSKCTAPIVGPDDPTQVHYDPSNDDSGCFVTEQSKNNCYDYGNDIVTNSFAQPGRGSGVCPPNTRPCVKNTCDDVKNAAISDGLTWVGMDLPATLPASGHYVSLHIWPDSNFHWIRMDANKLWSHKPGGSPVKNHDNNGATISDPSKADFSPWTQHCGYMLAVPSTGKITDVFSGHTVVI